MSLGSTLLIASSGLDAINRQLAVVSQNVANANTPGYVRESTPLDAVAAGGLAMGVRAGPAQRDLDTHLRAAVFAATSSSSYASTRQAALSAIDQVAGSTGSANSVSDLLGGLQDQLSALEVSPSDQTVQREVVLKAQQLAGAVNQLGNAGTVQHQGAQDSVVIEIGQLNAALRQIGQLSVQIAQAHALGQGTAELEQSRDAQMTTATGLTGVRFAEQANGGMQAIMGGIVLPLDATTGDTFQVGAAQLAPGTPATAVPGITLQGQDVTAQLKGHGGSIGANLQIRDDAMPQMQAELDEFAHTLASRFDAQGLRLFTDGGGTVPPGGGTPAQTGYLGMAQTLQVNPAVTANPTLVQQGTTGAVTATGSTTMLQNVLTYAFGANSAPGAPQPPPATAGLGVAGTIQARFTAPGTLAGFATALGAAQAQDSAAAASSAGTEAATATAMQAKLSAASGVSMDTELSHMVALQNAYSANARVISAAQSMWDSLLSAVH
jgi:flagellar hook-associated protein 1 FlgK